MVSTVPRNHESHGSTEASPRGALGSRRWICGVTQRPRTIAAARSSAYRELPQAERTAPTPKSAAPVAHRPDPRKFTSPHVAPTAKARAPPARAAADEQPPVAIRKVDNENYGAPTRSAGCTPKLNRLSHQIAKRTVHRLMRAEGLSGMSRAKGPRTTIRRMRELDTLAPRRGLEAGEEAVHRPGPGCSGDGLRGPAPNAGQDTAGVIANWDKGGQYLAIRYTPSGRSRPALSAPWGPPAQLRRCLDRASAASRSPPSSTPTGSSTSDCTGRSGLVPPLSTRTTTTDTCPSRTTVGWLVQSQ